MDDNCYNYLQLDEQEIEKEEEERHKEIKALLANEFYDLEIEEDDEENNVNNESVHSDATAEIEESIIDNDSHCDQQNQYNYHQNALYDPRIQLWQPQQLLPLLYKAPQKYNYTNYQQNQLNNNCYGEEDVSINWEISLHDEMGMRTPFNNNKFYSDKLDFMATSNMPTKETPSFTKTNIEYPKPDPPSPMKIIKCDVGTECIPGNQRELDNLELLYSARGKRIEQLQTELDSEKEKRLRETRVLNHKVTLLESEQKNDSNILKSYKIELNDQRNNLLDKVKTIEIQAQKIEEFENEQIKLKDTVEARGCLIESLNRQLAELSTNTAMARNNQKQAELLDCINHQFDSDSHRFQSEISRLSERLDEKMKEIEKLHVQLDEQSTIHQSQKKLWTEEKANINEDLDEERKSRKKLEGSLIQDKINQLQSQISQINMGKSMVDDMNGYLQEEVLELTNQLLVYERSFSMLENKQDSIESSLGLVHSARFVESRRKSCSDLSKIKNEEEEISDNFDSTITMRKEIFSLTSRTHSLTNRLLDVRKDNLESKTIIKKMQHTISEQNDLLFALEEKFAKAETRLGQLESGNETDVEKQLRNSIKSFEIINTSMELQCKSLQTQLKQDNETIKEMEAVHRKLEEDFNNFRNILEEDKEYSIEEVKRACSSHYDNLRQQLEISWMTEKDLFISEERRLREELQNELFETIKEVDRVKNLYINLSQQKTNEQSDLTNWKEWYSKKLEDQKRSLNQQFHNDHQLKIMEINSQHNLAIEKLRSEFEAQVLKVNELKDQRFVGLDIGVQFGREMSSCGCQMDIVKNDNWVQTTDIVEETKELDDLKRRNEELQLAVDTLMEQIELDKLNFKTSESKDASTSPRNSYNEDTIFPHIIRSITPQLITSTKISPEKHSPLEAVNPRSSLPSFFKSLKEDLIIKLADVSRSMKSAESTPSGNHIPRSKSFMEPFDNTDRIKEHLKRYILQMQDRAASTLQRELHLSQRNIRLDLLRQLRQILPLTLSVDGQIIHISPEKIKILIDKVKLILDHLQNDEFFEAYVQCHQVRNSCDSHINYSNNFSATSTPKNIHFQREKRDDLQSDVTSIYSDDSFDMNTLKSPKIQQEPFPIISDPTVINDTLIRTRSEHLQDEIAKLSSELDRARVASCSVTTSSSSLFANVDQNWLCASLGGNVTSGSV